jgi:hypothetical protein
MTAPFVSRLTIFLKAKPSFPAISAMHALSAKFQAFATAAVAAVTKQNYFTVNTRNRPYLCRTTYLTNQGSEV